MVLFESKNEYDRHQDQSQERLSTKTIRFQGKPPSLFRQNDHLSRRTDTSQRTPDDTSKTIHCDFYKCTDFP